MNGFNHQRALKLMLLSRFFEEEVEYLFKEGLLHGTTHLSIGQEASHAGLSMALTDDDYIVTTHRCHGFTICRGASPFSMFSEMFGSRYGLAKGIGGSMHMPDPQHGNLGSSAVVGSGVPIACGAGFYLKYKKKNGVSVAVFGDGASSRGSVHESMNLSSVWNLPVLFYCENNLYGMSTPVKNAVSVENISQRGFAYNIKSETVDGNDILKVYEASVNALNYIKENHKPYILETMTYRYRGHSKNDGRVYRTREEEAVYYEKDPISCFERYLISNRIMSESQVAEITSEVKDFILSERTKAQNLAGEVLSTSEIKDLVYDIQRSNS